MSEEAEALVAGSLVVKQESEELLSIEEKRRMHVFQYSIPYICNSDGVAPQLHELIAAFSVFERWLETGEVPPDPKARFKVV